VTWHQYRVRGWRRGLVAVAALLLLALGITGLLAMAVGLLFGSASSGEPEPWGTAVRKVTVTILAVAACFLAGALALRWAIRPARQ
jgi:hypothetical protein